MSIPKGRTSRRGEQMNPQAIQKSANVSRKRKNTSAASKWESPVKAKSVRSNPRKSQAPNSQCVKIGNFVDYKYRIIHDEDFVFPTQVCIWPQVVQSENGTTLVPTACVSHIGCCNYHIPTEEGWVPVFGNCLWSKRDANNPRKCGSFDPNAVPRALCVNQSRNDIREDSLPLMSQPSCQPQEEPNLKFGSESFSRRAAPGINMKSAEECTKNQSNMAASSVFNDKCKTRQSDTEHYINRTREWLDTLTKKSYRRCEPSSFPASYSQPQPSQSACSSIPNRPENPDPQEDKIAKPEDKKQEAQPADKDKDKKQETQPADKNIPPSEQQPAGFKTEECAPFTRAKYPSFDTTAMGSGYPRKSWHPQMGDTGFSNYSQRASTFTPGSSPCFGSAPYGKAMGYTRPPQEYTTFQSPRQSVYSADRRAEQPPCSGDTRDQHPAASTAKARRTERTVSPGVKTEKRMGHSARNARQSCIPTAGMGEQPEGPRKEHPICNIHDKSDKQASHGPRNTKQHPATDTRPTSENQRKTEQRRAHSAAQTREGPPQATCARCGYVLDQGPEQPRSSFTPSQGRGYGHQVSEEPCGTTRSRPSPQRAGRGSSSKHGHYGKDAGHLGYSDGQRSPHSQASTGSQQAPQHYGEGRKHCAQCTPGSDGFVSPEQIDPREHTKKKLRSTESPTQSLRSGASPVNVQCKTSDAKRKTSSVLSKGKGSQQKISQSTMKGKEDEEDGPLKLVPYNAFVTQDRIKQLPNAFFENILSLCAVLDPVFVQTKEELALTMCDFKKSWVYRYPLTESDMLKPAGKKEVECAPKDVAESPSKTMSENLSKCIQSAGRCRSQKTESPSTKCNEESTVVAKNVSCSASSAYYLMNQKERCTFDCREQIISEVSEEGYQSITKSEPVQAGSNHVNHLQKKYQTELKKTLDGGEGNLHCENEELPKPFGNSKMITMFDMIIGTRKRYRRYGWDEYAVGKRPRCFELVEKQDGNNKRSAPTNNMQFTRQPAIKEAFAPKSEGAKRDFCTQVSSETVKVAEKTPYIGKNLKCSQIPEIDPGAYKKNPSVLNVGWDKLPSSELKDIGLAGKGGHEDVPGVWASRVCAAVFGSGQPKEEEKLNLEELSQSETSEVVEDTWTFPSASKSALAVRSASKVASASMFETLSLNIT